MDKEDVRAKIQSQVLDFRADYDKHKKELEANTETKLVEPLFAALGWTTKDFVKRDHAWRGGKSGFVDYAFKMENKNVFMLEVKKLGVPLEKEADTQVISYALSRRVPFAVSTNFENLKIFCVEQENAVNNVFRVFKRPEDYVENLGDLLFLHKESFAQNLLMRKAEDEGRLKKRISIDEPLLNDLMSIRNMIANDIERKYPKKYELNEREEIIQRIIDRLIFVRKCEDIGINPEGLLLEEITQNPYGKAHSKLREVFARYNDVYDGGLFAVGVDNDCDKIAIDGEIVQKLVGLLYESRDRQYIYNFDWIDADVLGQVYEQYLGKILAQTKSGKSQLKNGQAHRKEQGIYYTPTYIVDYIVGNTLGRVLNDKRTDAESITVLDPACGSGSFLIKAFDYFKDRLYSDDGHKTRRIDEQGMYSLKTAILKNNLYGVDLDAKAVEITKLNLLLKAAERYRRLPEDTELHIRHGNSLVDSESIAGLNAFKWEKEFRHVFKDGGFDIIIGNPPYVKEFVNREIFEDVKEGSSRVAQYYEGKMDYLYFFVELGIDMLKDGGYLSFVTTNYWLQAEGAYKLRKKILDETTLMSVFDFGEFKVFEKTGQHNLVFVLRKKKNPNNKVRVSVVAARDIQKTQILEALQQEKNIPGINKFLSPPQSEFLGAEHSKIAFVPEGIERVCERIHSKVNYILKSEDVAQGIVAPQEFVIDSHLEDVDNKKAGDGIFTLSNTELAELNLNEKEETLIKPFFTSESLGRYLASEDHARWIIYTDTKTIRDMDSYPRIKKHLDHFKKVITSDFGPYGLHRARKERFFLGEKVLCMRKAMRPSFSYVDFPCYVTQTFYVIQPEDINLKYLTGILNSKAMHFWLYFKGKKEGKQLQIDKAPILAMPIRSAGENEQHQVMNLVDKMQKLQLQLHGFGDKKTAASARIQSQIEETDAQLDQLVYSIYGLKETEIKVIEESIASI